MNKPFYFLTGAYREESGGQLAELDKFVKSAGLPRLYAAEEIALWGDLAELIVDGDTAYVPRNSVLSVDKKKNPDIVRSTRTALSMDAKGIVLLFGNNPNRDYIKDGLAYSAQEVKRAAEEAIRLSPLFNRKFEGNYFWD